MNDVSTILRLHVPDTEGSVRTITMGSTEMGLGRHRDNDVVITEHVSVSRFHAKIIKKNGEFILCDLESRFGTEVNGSSITEIVIKDNDTIVLGQAKNLPLTVRLSRSIIETNPGELQYLMSISQAINTEQDPHVVLDMVLESMIQISEASQGALILLSPDKDPRITVTRGYSPESIEKGTVVSKTVIKRVLETGDTVIISNVELDEKMRQQESVQMMDIKSVFCIPLKRRRLSSSLFKSSVSSMRASGPEIIGAIYLDHRIKAKGFDPAYIEVLELLADHATIAIYNSQLLANTERSKTIASSLLEASKVLNSTLELDQLLVLIMDLVTRIIDADRSTLFLVDHERGELWSKVLQADDISEIRIPMGTGIAGDVARTGEAIIVDDAYQDSRFDQSFDDESNYRTRSIIAVPAFNKENKVICVLQALNKKKQETFNNDDLKLLTSLSAHVAISIENAILHQKVREQERMEAELKLAAEIQNGLIPHELPKIHGLDVAALNIACLTVGGDYYDLVPLPDGSYLFVMADVSGKGIPASLLMANMQALLRAYSERTLTPVELAQKLNRRIAESSPSSRFITLFLAKWDSVRNELDYCNAGHNPPFILRQDGSIDTLTVGGMIIGILPENTYQQETVVLNNSDILVLFTDGVTEAEINEDEYGDERLIDCVRTNQSREAQHILNCIRIDVTEYTGQQYYSDDFTIMVIKRTAGEG